MASTNPTARCGSSEPHGAHVVDGRYEPRSFCAGNVNVVEAIVDTVYGPEAAWYEDGQCVDCGHHEDAHDRRGDTADRQSCEDCDEAAQTGQHAPCATLPARSVRVTYADDMTPEDIAETGRRWTAAVDAAALVAGHKARHPDELPAGATVEPWDDEADAEARTESERALWSVALAQSGVMRRAQYELDCRHEDAAAIAARIAVYAPEYRDGYRLIPARLWPAVLYPQTAAYAQLARVGGRALRASLIRAAVARFAASL